MSKSGVVTKIEYSNCGAGQKSEPAQFTFYFLFHLTKFMKSSSAISALARHNLISPLFVTPNRVFKFVENAAAGRAAIHNF